MIVYKEILERLAKAGWSTYRLRKEGVLGEKTLTHIRNGEPINTTTLDTICKLCDCQPGDVLEYVEKTGEE